MKLFNLLPDDLLKIIFKYIVSWKDYNHLRKVDKRFYNLSKETGAVSKFKFFKQHYKTNDPNIRYLLSPKFMSSFHVRANYRLIRQGIQEIKSGNIKHGEVLIEKAMMRHGSGYGMIFIGELSQQGGRESITSDLKSLSVIYQNHLEKTLMNEIRSFFQNQDDQNKCREDLFYVSQIFVREVISFMASFREVYRQDNGVSKINLQKVINTQNAQLEGLSKMPNPIPLHYPFKDFDVYGFIGLKEPQSPNAWYLSSESHKKFLELENIANDLLDDHSAVPATVNQPKLA